MSRLPVAGVLCAMQWWGCATPVDGFGVVSDPVEEGSGGAGGAAVTQPSKGTEVCDPSTEFACTGGGCIPADWTCNGAPNCADGSDEDHSSCGTGGSGAGSTTCNPQSQFTCSNGSCVSAYLQCDGYPDCPGGSDEAPYNGLCGTGCNPSTQFTCYDGSCIPSYFTCDGYVDCYDGSDEAPVNPSCGSGSCESLADCGNCGNCAISSVCAGQMNQCLYTNPACQALVDCYSACAPGNTACFQGCDTAHAAGLGDYMALIQCVVCDTCPLACDGPGTGCPLL